MMNIDSTKPYFIRAVHEWCTDQGFTPYLVVSVDARCKVPQQFVKGGKITLNVSLMATNAMSLGNQKIEFEASFSGLVQTLVVPIDRVEAIYARENKEGLWFEVAPPVELGLVPSPAQAEGEVVAAAPVAAAELWAPAAPAQEVEGKPEATPQGEDPGVDRGENMPKNQPARSKPHLTVVK